MAETKTLSNLTTNLTKTLIFFLQKWRRWWWKSKIALQLHEPIKNPPHRNSQNLKTNLAQCQNEGRKKKNRERKKNLLLKYILWERTKRDFIISSSGSGGSSSNRERQGGINSPFFFKTIKNKNKGENQRTWWRDEDEEGGGLSYCVSSRWAFFLIA